MDISGILAFLSELAVNNNREWMAERRSSFQRARDDFFELVGWLINEIAVFDQSLAATTPAESIFRLNRDIRFSADKSPYKVHFGAYMAEGGRKSGNAGYYLHLQPGNQSMLGGGIYMPGPEALKKIRQEIDYSPEALKQIVSERKFRHYFGAVQGEKLKTAPKGYASDHPNIEFLKLKSYFVIHSFTDAEALDRRFPERAVDVFRVMHPFNQYLNVAVS